MTAPGDGAGPGLPVTLTLEETARRLSRYQQVEHRLFQLMGQWAAEVPEPEVKLAFSIHAPEHAWHADLWKERLPAPLETSPDGELTPLLAAMSEVGGPDRTIEKAVGIYRVLLPRLVVAYRRHHDTASALADGPVKRALKLVLSDETEEWHKGEALVQDLLVDRDHVSRAATHQTRLESLLVQE